MRSCECGGKFEYDGYNEIEIDDRGLLYIVGDCKCNLCGTEGKYTEYHTIDFDNPFNIEIIHS